MRVGRNEPHAAKMLPPQVRQSSATTLRQKMPPDAVAPRRRRRRPQRYAMPHAAADAPFRPVMRRRRDAIDDCADANMSVTPLIDERRRADAAIPAPRRTPPRHADIARYAPPPLIFAADLLRQLFPRFIADFALPPESRFFVFAASRPVTSARRCRSPFHHTAVPPSSRLYHDVMAKTPIASRYHGSVFI